MRSANNVVLTIVWPCLKLDEGANNAVLTIVWPCQKLDEEC